MQHKKRRIQNTNPQEGRQEPSEEKAVEIGWISAFLFPHFFRFFFFAFCSLFFRFFFAFFSRFFWTSFFGSFSGFCWKSKIAFSLGKKRKKSKKKSEKKAKKKRNKSEKKAKKKRKKCEQKVKKKWKKSDKQNRKMIFFKATKMQRQKPKEQSKKD